MNLLQSIRLLIPVLASLACACASTGADAGAVDATKSDGLPTVAKKVADLERLPGLYDLYLDRAKGKVWLALPPADADGLSSSCLYVCGLATGLGSNPVGLDRARLGPTLVVEFRRYGRRVFVEQPNLDFRALSEDPHELRATRESFATSILWAGEVAAEDRDGRMLVDFTSFVVRDANGIARSLKGAGQGTWSLDAERSALDPTSCLVFPRNVELAAKLTLSGSEPGAFVRETAPAAQSVTLTQHHSLLALPDEEYEPLGFDPRAGHFGIRFRNYAAAIDEPLDVGYALRHRMRDVNGRVRPLVYYVDRGAPEPVRSALVEGASWWADAFARAGFPGAFRVELLPEDAHPLDARYHTISWVHRSTRGWSMGTTVSDPRTGEILRAQVLLGSLRVRQDRLLFEGLAGCEQTGTGGADDPVEIALARIRQLAAHEVGHTLGLAHNFAASTYGRASVMDYPAPLVRLDASGQLDFSEAYDVGVGAWDELAIRYLYDESGNRPQLLEDARQRGMVYLTDGDARPAGASHPLANLWDNGTDPAAELTRVLGVRRVALERFGERNLAEGRPFSELAEVLVPVYLHHRYQLDAALKMVGGMTYEHARKGDGRSLAQPVSGADQRRALDAILALLDPRELDLPENVLALLLPPPPGAAASPERFDTHAAPAFDALGAASSAAAAVVDGLLQPERCARLVDFHRRDADLPGLEEVCAKLAGRVFPGETRSEGDAADTRREALTDVMQRAVFDGLVRLVRDPDATAHVRALAEEQLSELASRLARSASPNVLVRELRRFLERGEVDPGARPGSAPLPPGSPIGFDPTRGCSRWNAP